MPYCPYDILQRHDYLGKYPAPRCASDRARDLCCLYAGTCALSAASPEEVPLDDDGYKLIAETRDTDAAVAYLERVAFALQGTVADADKLREFAAFSSNDGEVVAESYADLKRQLHIARLAAKTGDKEKEKEAASPLVKTEDKPLKKGALVQRSGRKGEVISCKNPDEVLTWEYEVQFDDGKEPEAVSADLLDSRMDMRWMSGDAMLALIPNSVEDSLVGWTAFFRNLTATLHGVEKPIREVAGWKDSGKSFTVAAACLALAVLFIWIQRVFFFAVTSFVFAKNTEMWIAFFAKRRGLAAFEKAKAARDVSEWGFFVKAELSESEKVGSKAPLLQSIIDGAKKSFRMSSA